MFKFGSKDFVPDTALAMRFSIKAAVGRFFSRKYRQPKNTLLHLGCGSNIMVDFENLDFYRNRFWKTDFVGHDLRYPLPYEDKVFEGAFSEHVIEHLYPSHAINLLREVQRVLKPGAIFRICVPDLKKYIAFYNGDRSDSKFAKFSSGCEAIWNLTQNWGHVSCWDAQMLGNQLLDAGFKSIKECQYLVGHDPRLLRDLEHRRWESLYVEAVA